MTCDPRWRRQARELLCNYTTYKEQLQRLERDILLRNGKARDHRYRRGGVSNPTMCKALELAGSDRVRLERQVKTVERLIDLLRQDGRRHRLRRLHLLELVYLRHSHSLTYAAAALDISYRSAKRMNDELLRWVAHEMGWLEHSQQAGQPGQDKPEQEE